LSSCCVALHFRSDAERLPRSAFPCSRLLPCCVVPTPRKLHQSKRGKTTKHMRIRNGSLYVRYNYVRKRICATE
jgi:hypothetical protein